MTISKWFEHARWRLLYRRHLAKILNETETDGPRVVVKEETLWRKNNMPAYVGLRIETWIERIGTSTVITGHKLVEPSKGMVIATGKVVAQLQRQDRSIDLLPDRPRLQTLIGRDPDCTEDMHTLYDAISSTTSQETTPFESRSFLIGPADLDGRGDVSHTNFIKFIEQARFEQEVEKVRLSGGGKEALLPPTKQMALEFINTPQLSDQVVTKLWPAKGMPGSCLVEISDTETGRVYCRAVVDGSSSMPLEARL